MSMNKGFQRFLKTWFASRAGEVIYEQEKQLIDHALHNVFGYFLVQLGCVSHQSLAQQSRVSTKVLIDPFILGATEGQESVQSVQADFEFLPIKRDSVDVVLLPHTLESIDDPYYLLRQVDAMVVGEGHIILTGFNPFGCLSLRYRFKTVFKQEGFQSARFRRHSKLKEWLEVLGYEVEVASYSPVMCFSRNEKYKRWGRMVEKIECSLKGLGLEFGNVYCLVAKKKLDAPTIVGVSWHLPNWQATGNSPIASQCIESQKRNKLNRIKGKQCK